MTGAEAIGLLEMSGVVVGAYWLLLIAEAIDYRLSYGHWPARGGDSF